MLFLLCRRLAPAVALATALTLSLALPAAKSAAQDHEGPNINIVRWAKGTYEYIGTDDGRLRGTESFHLIVHADGSRTLIAWNDLKARSGHVNTVLRVAENFRPQEASVSFWTGGGYQGAGTFTINGGTASAIVTGPQGQITQSFTVPGWFSFGTTPLAADGWHSWYYDYAEGGPQPGVVYSLDAGADLTRPILARRMEQTHTFLGEEDLTVPAGTFTVQHFKKGGADIYFMGEDRILVKAILSEHGLEYVLTDFVEGRP